MIQSADTTETAVRRSVTVAAPQARAFEMFTAKLGTWWPPSAELAAGVGELVGSHAELAARVGELAGARPVAPDGGRSIEWLRV
jgi:hypothetical protein